VRRREGARLEGTASTSLLVGVADPEMVHPRLHRRALERIASASGGRVIDQGAYDALADALRFGVPAAAARVQRDLWHNGVSFGVLLALLGAEWVTRRRWGLR
jgi:hypothetical protein